MIEDLNCTGCGEKTTFVSQKRFISFPVVLLVVLRREVFNDWVPKKLEFALTFDNADANVTLNAYKSVSHGQIQPGEVALPEGYNMD